MLSFVVHVLSIEVTWPIMELVVLKVIQKERSSLHFVSKVGQFGKEFLILGYSGKELITFGGSVGI